MRIALIGNPNAGKSSLFNHLTGLHQKVGNFPGVTVEKKTGFCKLNGHLQAEILDLPGAYSLYAKSPDEAVVIDTLLHPDEQIRPHLAVVIADATNLKRNLLLFTQVKDLGIPVLLVLSLLDVAESKGLKIDLIDLKKQLDTEIIPINARTGKNVEVLKEKIASLVSKNKAQQLTAYHPFLNTYFFSPQLVDEIKQKYTLENDYLAFHYAQQSENLVFLNENNKASIEFLREQYHFPKIELQKKELLARYEIIEDILRHSLKQAKNGQKISRFSEKLDQIFLHGFWGYLVFFLLLFMVFQSIFSLATIPMNWIEVGMGWLQESVKNNLPKGVFNDLLADGVLAGVAGIVVFIPQIAILFAFISILEESGYMARVMFLTDKLMRNFGLNGKSLLPLISGVACAVPAIMATRNIPSWKERIITIFVTPLMSCSARIPVYAVLIALVVPNTVYFGFIQLQALAMMFLYLLGFVMAILSAFVLKLLLKSRDKSYFIMELPEYRMPRWANVGYTLYEKVKIFVLDAGKIILAIAIILWGLASYGPAVEMQKVKEKALVLKKELPADEAEKKIAALRLEASFVGQLGRWIEPVIAPLGFNWKIGIALITSFAAREVFIGTISTIYSIGNDDTDLKTIRDKIKAEVNPITGKPVFTTAVCFSLLVFYAFALQCMSTFATVYRETGGWKWPLAQFIYLTSLAYLASWLVFQLFN